MGASRKRMPDMECQQCGVAIREGKKFCAECGTPSADVLPPIPSTKIICQNCGADFKMGKKFCAHCGSPSTPEMQSAPKITRSCEQCGSTLKNGKKFCAECGAPAEPDMPPKPAWTEKESAVEQQGSFDSMPLPPPDSGGIEFVLGGADSESTLSLNPDADQVSTPDAQVPLPIDRAQNIHNKLKEVRAKATTTKGRSGLTARTDMSGMLQRMIRAARLDKTIYRELAKDSSLQNEAWKVMFLVLAVSSIGILFASIRYLSIGSGIYFFITVFLQVLAVMIQIWVTQRIAATWLKSPVGFNQFFRALVYAQSPAILNIIPFIGPLMWIWRVVTSTIAIRDVTGCSTKNAAIAAIIGLLAAIAAVLISAPFIGNFF